MIALRQVVVVIPVRNEQTLLVGCLAAVASAIAKASVPVRTVVVLDSCTDASADICSHNRVEALQVGFANVGRSRHAGVTRAMQTQLPLQAVWIANTDADSRVPPDWLAEQIRLADRGADAVLGVVSINNELERSVREIHQTAYASRMRPDGSHRHIHGANLGIRASTYIDSGGFPPLTDHEDRRLIHKVRALRSPLVVTSTSLRVETSGRTDGRCQDGFARSIAGLTPDRLSFVGRDNPSSRAAGAH